MPTTPPRSDDDPFEPAEAQPPAEVTNRILAKHAQLKAQRGGTSRVERVRAEAAEAARRATPRPEMVVAIILNSGWIDPARAPELRDFFGVRGVTQMLKRGERLSGALVEAGLLPPHLGRELELTLLDQGIIAGYRITRVLGQGLVGRTYVALDLGHGTDVAFKVFRQPDEAKQQRFLDQAAVVARIRNRRVATLLAGGIDDEVCYTASALAPGLPLARVIAERRVASEVQAARIALQIAEGLAYVNVTASLAHGQLHPGNVLVHAQEDDRLATVLTDFGLAGQTPSYHAIPAAWRAPECVDGASGDARSDIYALGAMFYNMLGAFAHPPRGQVADANGAIDLAPFRPLTRDIVYKATAPEPERRYRDYRSLIAALSQLVRELGFVERDEVPPLPGAEGPGTMFVRRARDEAGKDGWVG